MNCFCKLVVTSVMATEIVNKGLKVSRNNYLIIAFSNKQPAAPAGASNCKATIVIVM
jgi:hypothetical protein